MSLWLGLIIAVLASGLATLVKDMRRAALAVWVAGLGVGAVEMALGAEVLAVTQWILSSLALVVFVLFAVTFGEYQVSTKVPATRTDSEGMPAIEGRLWRWARQAGPALLGLAFTGVVYYGYYPLEKRAGRPWISVVGDPIQGTDLGAMAASLLRENFVALQIVAVLLLLVVVGAGMVSRLESQGDLERGSSEASERSGQGGPQP